MKKLIAIGSLAVLLGGCISTSYKDSYGESQLSPTVFDITTVANGFSYAGSEKDFAMLRAAEIACFKGYKTFDVLSAKREQPRQVSYAYLTIELKKEGGKYDAPLIIKTLSSKLDTETDCQF